MNGLVKYGLIALVIGGIYVFNSSGSGDGQYDNLDVSDIDLNAVLDVTIDTIYTFEETVKIQEEPDPDQAFIDFTAVLAENLNAADPALHDKTIGASPQTDASIIAYEDLNDNNEFDQDESGLFMIEIDGENSRVVATSRSGAVGEHRFSGTGLLAGYLIGSMLSRQRASGAASKVAAKKPVSASQAARARAGSGSHSRGK